MAAHLANRLLGTLAVFVGYEAQNPLARGARVGVAHQIVDLRRPHGLTGPDLPLVAAEAGELLRTLEAPLAQLCALVRGEELERHLDRRDEDEVAGVLHDEAVLRDVADATNGLLVGVRGEEDDRDVALGENTLGGGLAVDPRSQIDVHEHEIDPIVPRRHVDRFLARERRLDGEPVTTQHVRLGHRDNRLVFDEQEELVAGMSAHLKD